MFEYHRIYIRKEKYEFAANLLEREIEQAFCKGIQYVEIVHGIGMGKLKSMVLEFIEKTDYLNIHNSDFHYNPGSTLVEILSPDKNILEKYL